MTVKQDRKLTIHEVAKQLRCSTWTIRRMIHDGRLPAIKLGRFYRVLQSTIDNLNTK